MSQPVYFAIAVGHQPRAEFTVRQKLQLCVGYQTKVTDPYLEPDVILVEFKTREEAVSYFAKLGGERYDRAVSVLEK